MLQEGMYYEGAVYKEVLEDLKGYVLDCMQTGDDFDTAMDSARKSYDIMPVRYPSDMVMFTLGEMVQEALHEEYGMSEAKDDMVASEYTDAEDGKMPKYKYAYRKLGSSAQGPDKNQAKAMCSILRSKGIDADVPAAMKFLKSLDEAKLAETLKLIEEYTKSQINEEVEVEEAEVVIAARALGDQIQDAIEDVGRAFNEDLPAIVDQMRGQLGMEKAQPFGENVGQALDQLLGQLKDAKGQIDNAIGSITGEGSMASMDMEDPMADPIEPAGDMGDPMDDLGDPMADLDVDDFAGDDAKAGPEDEPLGREPK